MGQRARSSTPTGCAVLGLDLGSINVRGVLLDDRAAGVYEPSWVGRRPVGGRLLAALGDLLEELDPQLPVQVQATGVGRQLLEGCQHVTPHNEIVSLGESARAHASVRSVFEIGGHTSRWVLLDDQGEIQDYAVSEPCAAGTGAFIEQQAARLKLDPAGLSAAAMAAETGVPVAGRCSVFAKSDMIHLQQKGVPVEEIAYGLCLAVSRNVVATLLRGQRSPEPVALAGGCSANEGLARALAQVLRLESSLIIPPHAAVLPAIGAALAAPPEQPTITVGELRRQVVALISSRSSQAPEKGYLPRLDPPGAEGPEIEPSFSASDQVEGFVGVDVGSVSTNLVVLDRDAEVLDGIYLPTRGRPVEVLREGLSMLQGRFAGGLSVLGLGSTGSGRHLAARLLGADVVQNEITCQLNSALHYVDGADTVIEIGGQDSKFIRARDGRLVDFAMNKICAAGTGSFLEEESLRLGVSVTDQFAGQAFAAPLPANLGCRCTVFMDTEVVNALAREQSAADICAGLAYAIARNYLERVVERRPIGEKVVMQGGVASNRAVVAAFSSLLRTPVQVHPHNRISGAIGAALAARARWRPEEASAFLGLGTLDKDPEVRTFECKQCENRCQVSRITVNGTRAHFGDTCERYSAKDQHRPSEGGDRSVPDLFAEREEMVRASVRRLDSPLAVIGLPWASVLHGQYPFWATFLTELGLAVEVSRPSSPATLAAGCARLPAESCLPVKLTFGHVQELVDRGVDAVLFPSLPSVTNWEGEEHTLCPYVEGLPFMLRSGIEGPLLLPEVSLTGRPEQMAPGLRDSLTEMGLRVDDGQIEAALRAAAAVQQGMMTRLRARGAELLGRSGPSLRIAVLGKPYHLADPFQNLNLARHLRRLGVLALPMDALPVDDADEADLESVPWRYNRDILRALLWVRRQPDLFPILLTSFGCGPDAFVDKHLEGILRGVPYLELELDEHRAEAGLITRLEAYIDEIEQHRLHRRPSAAVDLSKVRIHDRRHYEGRRIFVPYVSDHAHVFVGTFRCVGLDARLLDPPDEALMARVESCSSGKECHPYAMLAADLDKLIDHHQPGDLFFTPGSVLPCLIQQYGVAMRRLLQARGVHDMGLLTPSMALYRKVVGYEGSFRLYCGLLAIDMLGHAVCAIRPYERSPGLTDAMHELNLEDLRKSLAGGDLGAALERCASRMAAVEVDRSEPRPLVGVAGDIYTRINPWANRRLFWSLEKLGCEVWPAPFLVDLVDKGLLANFRNSLRRPRPDLLRNGFVLALHLLAGWFVRRGLRQTSWREEPHSDRYQQLARRYVGDGVNALVQWNVAKMVDYASRGADGIVNAVGENCMAGTVSAAITRRIRRDHGGIPLITPYYGITESDAEQTALEAFVHQAKRFHSRRSPARR